MAAYTVTHKQITDNYAVLNLLTATDLVVGGSIDIADWLYVAQATSGDDAFLTICAAAANQFAYRRRQEAGYIDSLTTVPSQDVKLGTVMYGGALYRQRGSIDTFASFDTMGTAPVLGLSPIIKQLLGIDRPQVA
jgi:hypothetical protein